MKGDRLWGMIIGLLWIALLASCSRQNPIDLVKNYVQVYNQHEVEKALNFFADDVVVELMDGTTIKGKENGRSIAQYDSVLNVNLALSDMRLKGDTVICRATESNDWLDLTGLNEAHFWPCKTIVKNGLITWMSLKFTPETAGRFEQTFQSLGAWAAKDHMQEFQELLQSEYDIKGAQLCLSLTRQWRNEVPK